MSTIQKGLVTTNEVLPDSMRIDMREEISMTDADRTQFTTYTMRARHSTATREKINWREKDYFPRLVTVGTTYTAAATTVVLSAGQGDRVRKGDVLRNMATGGAMYVTNVVTDTLTVVPNIGTATGTGGTAGDTLLIPSNASPRG